MAIGNATRKKNSGILRYSFGGPTVNGSRSGQIAALVGDPTKQSPTIITCLGADADVIPDEDDQVFGEFPGHAAITGVAMFAAGGALANVVQRDGIQARQITINPVTGNFVDPTLGRFPGFIPAAAQPSLTVATGGTKVFAFFQATDADMGTSTVPAEEPYVVVQTEVKFNRLYRGGVADTEGPLYVSSIRVAVQNIGAATSLAAGILIVELQHSEHDILGALVQDQNFDANGGIG